MCKITAPDDEPQRGTVIQTDDSGRIATMPVGTPDRPVSRIISRDEYDRLNTPQGRSAGEARAEMGFGREQDLARQAMQIDPRDITADRQTGMPSAASVQQILRGREESQRGLPTLRMGQDDITAMAMSQPSMPMTPTPKPFRPTDSDIKGTDYTTRRNRLFEGSIPTPRPSMEERFSPTVSQLGDYGETFEPNLSPIVRPFAKQYKRDQEDEQGGLPTLRTGEDDITAMAMKAVENMEASQEENVNRNVGGFFDKFGLSTRFRRPDMPKFTGNSDTEEKTYQELANEIAKFNNPDMFGGSSFPQDQGNRSQPNNKNLFNAFKNFFRARYNRMGFGEELGEKQRPFLNQDSTQFANGGIVGLRRGGNGFTSNLKTRDDDEVIETIESMNQNPFMGGGSAIGSDAPQAGQQSISIGEKAQQDKEQQRQERMKDLQTGFESAFNVNVPNDPFKAMQSRINDPMYQDFLKSQDSPAAKYVNMFGKKVLGYDDPFEMYKATQAQLERNKIADAMRNKDRDRAMAESDMQKPFDPCPEGFTYDSEEQKCVPVEDEVEAELGQEFVRNPEAFTGDPNMYGRVGGEYNFFTEVPGLIKAANGIPRGPTGEIRGQGGPKDDLVGPFMLSDQEYVLPKEMIMAAGGGNYDTGIKQLETMRKNSLNKYGDYV